MLRLEADREDAPSSHHSYIASVDVQTQSRSWLHAHKHFRLLEYGALLPSRREPVTRGPWCGTSLESTVNTDNLKRLLILTAFFEVQVNLYRCSRINIFFEVQVNLYRINTELNQG